MHIRSLNLAIPILLFLFITGFMVYFHMDYDMECFQQWALYIHRHGLNNAYGSDTDYMPLYQYILWLYGQINGTDKAILDNISYLRCFTLAFDFLGLFYVVKWIDKKVAYYIVLVICILNLGYSFDTIIWGQVDGILSALVFIAVYQVWKGNNVKGGIFLVLALSFKVQAIVIVPVWVLLFVYNVVSKGSWKSAIWPVFVMFLSATALIYPFTKGQYGVDKITHVLFHSFNKYPLVSIQASNIWQLIVHGNVIETYDTQSCFAGLTYKQLGLVLFFTASFFALLPLMLLVREKWKTNNKNITISRELVWFTSAMVYLLFYFFNTEIHERYCQPAFIFITAYAFFSGDFMTYILFSIMYFLTLEHSMHHLNLPTYGTLIFDLRFLAAINILIIVSLGNKIYRSYKRHVDPLLMDRIRATV